MSVWDTTMVTMLRRASEKEALVESARGPALSVDRNPDAARVHDETTSMERLELVEQGLSKLRPQPLLTVAV